VVLCQLAGSVFSPVAAQIAVRRIGSIGVCAALCADIRVGLAAGAAGKAADDGPAGPCGFPRLNHNCCAKRQRDDSSYGQDRVTHLVSFLVAPDRKRFSLGVVAGLAGPGSGRLRRRAQLSVLKDVGHEARGARAVGGIIGIGFAQYLLFEQGAPILQAEQSEAEQPRPGLLEL
jgi:hypothetical protein